MILGIDVSNIRSGGGITHLVEVLRVARPGAYGFTQVIVWGGRATLARLEDRPWLIKAEQSMLNGRLLSRVLWQRFVLSRLAYKSRCDVLLIPGGSYGGTFRPVVAMCRNMLPFEWREMARWGLRVLVLKWVLLRWTQTRTFRRAQGVIFLTKYARDVVMNVISTTAGVVGIIPHGVSGQFSRAPREQRVVSEVSAQRPYRIVYVSAVDMYKHQWKVVEAIAKLREGGLAVTIEFIGPSYSPALRRLKTALRKFDPKSDFVQYSGAVPHEKLKTVYAQADMFLFASTCENMPNILLEGMASGLPIVSSNRGPMPEVLGDAGVYFDPDSPDDIARAIRELMESPELRERLAQASFRRAKSFSWSRCADETFAFLAQVATAGDAQG